MVLEMKKKLLTSKEIKWHPPISFGNMLFKYAITYNHKP